MPRLSHHGPRYTSSELDTTTTSSPWDLNRLGIAARPALSPNDTLEVGLRRANLILTACQAIAGRCGDPVRCILPAIGFRSGASPATIERFVSDPMALSSGTRLGACNIIALIVAGGMGEVYKANDVRLDRGTGGALITVVLNWTAGLTK
jgi:hypothetical protein